MISKNKNNIDKSIPNWVVYNHALMPTSNPHEPADIDSLKNCMFRWNSLRSGVFFARYTSDWDSKECTNFWYVIKDSLFDISTIKAKRRYEIKKGLKKFVVKLVDLCECINEVYHIQEKAFAVYPKKYRPKVTIDSVNTEMLNFKRKHSIEFAAYDKETGKMEGYAIIIMVKNVANFVALKVNPSVEKEGINAAIVYNILWHLGMISNDKEIKRKCSYINDGARNIMHETNFQEYLEKYFGFRKAYCRLHLLYRFDIRIIIKCLYVFRKQLIKLDGNRLIHKINSVMKMEEWNRESQYKI